MSAENRRTVQVPGFGYRQLQPVPADSALQDFYQSKYYDLIRKMGRAPEICRLMSRGTDAQRERAWLQATLYDDIHSILRREKARRVLDVGCGTGDLLVYLSEQGFSVKGIEPSTEATGIARSRGLQVDDCTLEQLLERRGPNTDREADAIVMINVLEHVPDPGKMIESAKELLAPGGLLCIRVPNDFNVLQLAAQEQTGMRDWWIAYPDHINYFDFESLQSFLEHFGFGLVHAQGDFPMELFLLMGDNYIGDPQAGSDCHHKRVKFEMALPGEVRRRLYKALASAGMGRNCLVFGKNEA